MRDNDKEYRSLFVGVDNEIVTMDGRKVIPINFDNAATTPPLKIVKDNIEKYMLNYGSIGRGSGFKSIETTELYEATRDVVLNFCGVKNLEDYTVIYVKNTTEGLNLLANVLIDNKNDQILSTRMEHHANDLPWRAVGEVLYVETDKYGKLLVDDIEDILKKNNIKIVTVTAASNVTGYINPIYDIAKLAHKYGAMIVVDGAQIIAHNKVYVEREDTDESLDFFVFSGHKMYAPMGSGVIVAKKSKLVGKNPFLRGGGAINIVFDEEEYWGAIPQIYEAGTQNFFGVLSIATSMMELERIGLEKIEEHEMLLKKYLFDEARKLDNIVEYGCAECANKLALLCFGVKGIYHKDVALALARRREIAVRSGCFCAHSYLKRLLGLSDQSTKMFLDDETLDRPGLVRVSLGLYNSFDEIDEFIQVIKDINNR